MYLFHGGKLEINLSIGIDQPVYVKKIKNLVMDTS